MTIVFCGKELLAVFPKLEAGKLINKMSYD
jgi:hypothetical protein